MGEARERDELLKREKVIGLFRKWLVYVLGILFLWILYPTEFANFNLRLFFTFGAIYFVYSLYVLTLASGLLFRVLWYLLYLVELAYISFLIFYSRGMDSNLFIIYPLVLIGIAMVRTGLPDFLVAGALGHFSYVTTLLIYYSSLKFYLTPFFWVQSLGAGAVFALGMLLIRFIREKNLAIQKLALQLKEASQTAEHLTITNGHTGLYNKKYFLERLEEEVKRAARYGSNLTLLLLCPDSLKNFGDLPDQATSDAILLQLSTILRQQVRETDLVCRCSEEEFAVIMPSTSSEGGLKLAERLRRKVETFPFAGKGQQPWGISISLGVASYPGNAEGSGELLQKAKKALSQDRESKESKSRPHLSLIVGSNEKNGS